MTPKEDVNNQTVSVEDSKNVDITNIKIDTVEELELHIHYGNITDSIETKKFDDKLSKTKWENEETLISIDDFEVIKNVIKSEKEVKEAIPLISTYIDFFKILPKIHKGLFISAINTILREDKITKHVSDGANTSNTINEELIEVIKNLEEDERFSSIFTHEVYEDYKKVYNIIRSGDLSRKVLPFIEKLKKDNTELKYEIVFEKYWFQRLANHPYAVFLSNEGSFNQERLKIKVLDKFENEENENVRVYARGDPRIILARAICISIAQEKRLKIKENPSKIGFDNHIEFMFE